MSGKTKLTEVELDALASECSADRSVGITMTDREAIIVAVIIGLLCGAVVGAADKL